MDMDKVRTLMTKFAADQAEFVLEWTKEHLEETDEMGVVVLLSGLAASIELFCENIGGDIIKPEVMKKTIIKKLEDSMYEQTPVEVLNELHNFICKHLSSGMLATDRDGKDFDWYEPMQNGVMASFGSQIDEFNQNTQRG